jgi:hypothetical protein
VLADSTSDDSDSVENGAASHGSCLKLMKMIKLNDDKFKLMDFDAKVGLNASVLHHNYPCLLDEDKKKFFVWLGDITIDKFNKSTFMNLANFAENNGATSMVLIQNRDHCQKDQFRKLFKVLDAHRVKKGGMKEMLNKEKIEEYMQKYGLYQISL